MLDIALGRIWFVLQRNVPSNYVLHCSKEHFLQSAAYKILAVRTSRAASVFCALWNHISRCGLISWSQRAVTLSSSAALGKVSHLPPRSQVFCNPPGFNAAD